MNLPIVKPLTKEQLQVQVQWLETEIERLRAALQQIIDEADSDNGLTAWDGADIAREALQRVGG